jgi:hypothetical protein
MTCRLNVTFGGKKRLRSTQNLKLNRASPAEDFKFKRSFLAFFTLHQKIDFS